MIEQIVECSIDATAPISGQTNQDPASVVGVLESLDESDLFKAVDAVGHRARGHQRLRQQCTGGKLVRRAGSTERGEDVERPGLQVMRGKGRSAGAIKVAGQAADSAEHFKRCRIKVGAFATPGLDEAIEFIAGAR